MLYVLGMSGPEVEKINAALVEQGYLDVVDDQFDESTEQAVKYFQEDAGVKVDGKVGPVTWAALFPSRQVAGKRPPMQNQLLQIYGRPNYQDWRRRWIKFINLGKYQEVLDHVKEFRSSQGFGLVAHKDMEAPLIATFDDLMEQGLLEEITSCGGAFNIRPMRGRSVPSVHSYGLAVDLNVPENPFGADGYSWSDEFAQTWANHGWEWGYIWDKPVDSMHFQWAWTRDWTEYEGEFIPKG